VCRAIERLTRPPTSSPSFARRRSNCLAEGLRRHCCGQTGVSLALRRHARFDRRLDSGPSLEMRASGPTETPRHQRGWAWSRLCSRQHGRDSELVPCGSTSDPIGEGVVVVRQFVS
jgi:hypothetical protein